MRISLRRITRSPFPCCTIIKSTMGRCARPTRLNNNKNTKIERTKVAGEKRRNGFCFLNVRASVAGDYDIYVCNIQYKNVN